MTDIEATLLRIIRYGLGGTIDPSISNGINWSEVLNLASMHGVAAIALDGIQRCMDENNPINIDLQTKLEWIGVTNQQEAECKRQENVIASLAGFYQQHDIRMMVLKGWGLSLNYPIPSHRPCSDLDIYLFGDQKRADQLIRKELGIDVDNGHHHHTVFVYQGVTVENHYDFLNVYSHRSTKKVEKILKDICSVEKKVTTIQGQDVYIPPADFNALFVLRHMAVEFAATGMILRQLLDWGLLMKKHHTEVNWDMVLPVVKEMNMHQFLDAINYICYTYLGFEKGIFHGFGNEAYGERVWADLFNPNNMRPKEKGSVKYILSRWDNWWRNRWRHKIVYSDSLLATFFYQVVSHLMKPATLHH